MGKNREHFLYKTCVLDVRVGSKYHSTVSKTLRILQKRLQVLS